MGQALVQTKYYTFSQNNSGGWFAYDFFAGIGQKVIVEAIDRDHAVARAKQIGLYFDGRGDCVGCCGYRWSEPWDEDGTAGPEIYGETIEEYLDGGWAYGPSGEGEKQVFVHLTTGQILAY
ncbi:hypothetical protein [Micromonospora sp. GCM10011541]|uniref:DUF7296 family protein n=1 Tax=Micromonospora sp. GCM10011541 TaxID=3317336 RepID=UPI003611258B